MNATIVRYDNVIGLSFEYTDLLQLALCLRELILGRPALDIMTNIGCVSVKLNHEEPSFVSVHNDAADICISLNVELCIDLIQAIEEYKQYYREFPFDHSLESVGVKITPASITDLVIETDIPEGYGMDNSA